MPCGIRGYQKGHKHTSETKLKIGQANSKQVFFKCDYCGSVASDRPSHYAKKKRHFCSNRCYSLYRKEILPKSEQNRFGTGFDIAEREKRKKARTILNHYLRDNHIKRQPCEICGAVAEAHHDDYDKPLEIRWLCFKHHRQLHKEHENPELIR